MQARPLILSALILGTLAGVTDPAFAARRHAKQAVAVAAPEITSVRLSPLNQLTPGSELTLTMEGTPRGVASVRLAGVARNIPLQEVDPGVYEGTYTVSSRDRLLATASIRATLKVRGRSTVLTQPMNGTTAVVAAAPTVAAPAPVAVGATTIERFSVKPVSKIEPGADLRFTLTGTPRARASFTIDEVARDIPMSEIQPGVYEGGYTIRRLDNFPSTINITATLDANGQPVRMRLNQPLVVDGKPPVVKNLSPHDGEVVINNPVLISATFDDAGGIGVDTKTVRVIVGGNDVSRSAGITPQFFSYRADLKPGTYNVEVSGKDMAGKPLRQAWSFTVASAAAPAPTVIPLQITSHLNNAQVGAGPVDVRGRTAPDAKVDVQVQAIASIAGFFGITQQIYAQTLKADANGNFGFTFQPQVTVPGTRYEASINASKGELSKETKLILFQQK